MTTILYIHGFLSSPASSKAQVTQSWLAQHHPNITFACPYLSSYPCQARETLLRTIDALQGNEPIYAIGSSLGGYWATHLVEQGLVEKAVLVNPAVSPQTRFPEFVGQRLKSYYTDDEYTLTEKDLQDLIEYDSASIQHPEKYWVMLQRGDETLDYRLAVKKYHACKQLVEEGGSHTFDGYENWMPEILAFFLGDDDDPRVGLF